MSIYNKRIGENFDHMQTKPEEWVQADILQYDIITERILHKNEI